ncbi:MAG: hypothetical protein NC191_02600 [Muribaculaceae bacterium]|nr:hypothetical protein [Muribaculaceae bacterium]
MNKKFAIISSENTELNSAIKKYFEDKCEIVEKNADLSEYKFLVLTGFNEEKLDYEGQILNIHPSLLPSFKGEDAIQQSFLYGAKVSGITIHNVEKDNFYSKIIAQAPILIGNSTHFDELKSSLIKLAIQVYPKVISTVLNDTVFDFSDLITGGCSGSCGGNCSHCSH